MRDFNDELVDQIPFLRRYAFALTSARSSADDLVQDTLERALRRQRKFQRGTNLRAWIFTIMHNIFIDQVRRRARRPEAAPIEGLQLACPSSSAGPGVVELGELQRAISRLPYHNREVLLLVGLEGLSYEEVAGVLDVPVGTVKSRLFRARQALSHFDPGAPPAAAQSQPCDRATGPDGRPPRSLPAA
jgi:RNA polymerase sigma-70 factor (ECF subfamily)